MGVNQLSIAQLVRADSERDQLPEGHFTSTQQREQGMGSGTTGPIKVVASASEIVLRFWGLFLIQLPLL